MALTEKNRNIPNFCPMLNILLQVLATLFLLQVFTLEAALDNSLQVCPHNDFFCVDSDHCIAQNQTCSGIRECKHGEDESVQICGCPAGEFQCSRNSNQSHCIDMVHRCDREKDCQNGEDEIGCETFECRETHVKCANHYCVPRDVWCDFKDDCGDNTDEVNCKRRDCWHAEFRCNNSECITEAYICDGSRDCLDGSDEENCEVHVKCANQLYVSKDRRCDGWVDCVHSMEDELHCGPCSNHQFKCNNTRCIEQANVCDGVCDCGFSCEDESKCPEVPCLARDTFQCMTAPTTRCLRKEYVCNGRNECWDSAEGHDESQCSPNDCADGMLCDKRCVQKCNGLSDCVGARDEIKCEHECAIKDQEVFKCLSGECIPLTKRCDNIFDCIDLSDERDCAESCGPSQWRCDAGQCIENYNRCDFHRDCLDGSDEKKCDNIPKETCPPNHFKCHNGQCIPDAEMCIMGKKQDGRPLGCADLSHLLVCKEFPCNSSAGLFKCRKSYCVHQSKVCDHHPDCKVTITDEEPCEQPCPAPGNMVCMCSNGTMDCSRRNLTYLPDITYEKGINIISISGNQLGKTLNLTTFSKLDAITQLDLSGNGITEIGPYYFLFMWRLATLGLQKNHIQEIRNGSFLGLSNLTTLYLQGNRIKSLTPEAFVGLSSLKALDLSYQDLQNIPRNAFSGLYSLQILNLSHNKIKQLEDGVFNHLEHLSILDISVNLILTIEDKVFYGLTLGNLLTDEFRFCCLAPSVYSCKPDPDEFSSCQDLMSNIVLRVSIWIMGIVAIIFNLIVMVWRISDSRESKVHSFLITNLAMGDFLMGIYLLLIANTDVYYRGIYIIHDKFWRESALCKIAGFLSTLSSEISVFTLTVITIDRFVSIIFPFRVKRLNMRHARVVMAVLWLLVITLAMIPLFNISYFSNFYGRSGVCLALHITKEKPPGWEYAVFIFLALNLLSFIIIATSYIWMFVIARQTHAAVCRNTESRNDRAMARRMTLIVLTDFCCWVPIILLGFISLGGVDIMSNGKNIGPQVFAWVAVFILPLNAAVNPVLYTLSTASYLGKERHKAFKFRKSFMSSLNADTKTSIIDDRISQNCERPRFTYTMVSNKKYQQLEMVNIAGSNENDANQENGKTRAYTRSRRNDDDHATRAKTDLQTALSYGENDPMRDEVVYGYDDESIPGLVKHNDVGN